VTTTGVVPDKLSELMNMNHNGVMLSLHAGRDETYGKVIPANRSLSEIISSLREIWKDLSRNKKRKTGFNYMLLDGLNDSDAEVEAFCKIISEFKEGVTHLLVCNDVEGSRYEGVSDEVLQSIYQTFREKGLNVRRANGWRRMREGGCGTLFAKEIADE
jgi:23S rRNA (adenine2503-C2)-methyltransferase